MSKRVTEFFAAFFLRTKSFNGLFKGLVGLSEAPFRVQFTFDESHSDDYGNVSAGLMNSFVDIVSGTHHIMSGNPPSLTVNVSNSQFRTAKPGDVVVFESTPLYVDRHGVSTYQVDAKLEATGDFLASGKHTIKYVGPNIPVPEDVRRLLKQANAIDPKL